MAAERARIGIVGFGYIGSYVYEQVTTRPELGMDVAFVHNRTPDRISAVPEEVILDDLGNFASRQADLIVELAHPDISRKYGVEFLRTAHYMPMSLTVFADAEIDAQLRAAAESSGTCIYIPHGAIVGLESLEEGRQMWDEVSRLDSCDPYSCRRLATDAGWRSVGPTWGAASFSGGTACGAGSTFFFSGSGCGAITSRRGTTVVL